MLNTFAGYVLGRCEQQKEAAKPPGRAQEPSATPNGGGSQCGDELTTYEADENLFQAVGGVGDEDDVCEGEWILLDYSEDELESGKSSCDESLDAELCGLALRSLPVSALSSSHPSPASGGWHVAPPTCFVDSGKNGATILETSSFENLLIEHPSMSVYSYRSSNANNAASMQDSLRERNRQLSEGDDASFPEQEDDMSSIVVTGTGGDDYALMLQAAPEEARVPAAQLRRLEAEADAPQPTRRRHAAERHAPQVVSAATLLRQATEGARRQQKMEAEQLKRQTATTRSVLRRANQIAGGCSPGGAAGQSGRPKSRKYKMKDFSGKNNDRKCQ